MNNLVSDSRKDYLFELIKSLNRTEKRYFSIYASRHVKGESNNYLDLFDAIDSLNYYDEEKLLKRISGLEVNKNLNYNKHYLHRLILKSLHSFHSDITINAKLKELIHCIEILYSKELYEQCEKMLHIATKLATKYENEIALLELSQWRIALYRIQYFKGQSDAHINSLHLDTLKIIKKIKQDAEYEALTTKITLAYRSGTYLRSAAAQKKYDALIDNPLLQNIDKLSSFKVITNYYLCHSLHELSKNHTKKAYEFSNEILIEFEKYPKLINEYPVRYITALANVAASLFTLHQYDRMPEILEKMNTVEPSYENIQRNLFYVKNLTRLHYYIITGKFEDGLKHISSIMERIDDSGRSNTHTFNKVILYYNTAYVYFGAGDYKKANKYLSIILNDESLHADPQLICFAKIVSLLSYYEQDKQELLNYAVVSNYRFLYRKKNLYKTESILLNFIRTQARIITTNKKRTEAFQKLKSDLEKVQKDKFEQNALQYFDLIAWIESKIEHKSFADIVQRKIRSGN